MSVIDFPAIDTEVTPVEVKTTAVATIKGIALAKVRACEPALRALAERYRDVVYDVSTPKGLQEAKDARHDLRENGRYAVQRAEQAVKDEANAVKKDIAPEAARLIAIVQPAEDDLDRIIKAREAEIEAEKERKRQAEAARVQAHREAIAKIRAYTEHAKGLPAARIQLGIDRLEGIHPGAEFEEFMTEAQTAKAETLGALRQLHADTLAREEEAARLEAQRKEQERIAAEQKAEAERLAAQRAELERQQAEIIAAAKREQEEQEAARRAAQPATPSPAPDTREAAPEGTAVTPAPSQREAAPQDQLDIRSDNYEAGKRGWRVTADGIEANTTAQQEAGQAAAQGTEANPSPCQAQTSLPGPAADEPTIKLGDIGKRLGFNLTEAFVTETLRIAPKGKERAACIYPASHFARICDALIAHIQSVRAA